MGETMDVNLIINIVAGLAVIDVMACVVYNLYMLQKYSDGACGKFAIDFLPLGMLLKIASIMLLLLICYTKYINDHYFFLPLVMIICGLMVIADLIARRVDFLINGYN